jgi:hypothetical protein
VVRRASRGATPLLPRPTRHARTLRSMLVKLEDATTQGKRDALIAEGRRAQDRAAAIEAARKKALEDEQRRIRVIPVVIPKECQENPFAPGCAPK